MPFTAFENNSYEFEVFPFGLSNGTQTFTVAMNRVLGNEVQDYSMCYVDDNLIFSRPLTEYLQHIDTILLLLGKGEMTVKLRKSGFAQTRVHFLGHIISPRSINKDGSKVEAILDLQPPVTVKQVRRFLGILGHRNYITGFSQFTVPLFHLIKEKKIWKCTD